MNIPQVSVDEHGIHTPTYDEWHAWLIWNFREIYGQDIYLEADSQDGQLIGIFALALYNSAQTSAMAYHSFAPNFAQGTGLSRMVKINGITRRTASLSTVDVRIVGQVGTTIRNGLVEDDYSNRWRLPVIVTIPPAGEIIVTADAVEAGAIRLQIGELSKIATPTRGWQTVENIANSVPGIAVESDADLRIRQTHSTALPSKTVNDGILGGILSVDGVVKARHYENFEGFPALPNKPTEPNSDGIPAHSICDVVLGGDVQEIADMIRLRKTPGTGVFGDVVIPTVDSAGMRSDMRFFRPTIIPVKIAVTLSITDRYDENTGTMIKNNIYDHVAALAIGEYLRTNRLFAPIEAADTSSYAPTFNVEGIEVAVSGADYSLIPIVRIKFNELIQTTVSDITIKIVQGD